MNFPYVDLTTKQIYNCNKNSLIWWHEQGHIKFNESNFASMLKIFQEYALLFWMFSMTFSILNKYMLILSIPLMFFYIAIEIYEEVWCNRFAKKNYKDL